jgi:hypothetical protein
MPRLNPIFERSVFFLYSTDPNTGKRKGPTGTGVLVSLEAESAEASWYDTHFYAVTCQHLAPRGSSIIRINTDDGKSRFIATKADDWQWLQGHDDLAAIDLTERLNRTNDVISFIPKRLFATKEFIVEMELGIGEDGFMLGLFENVPGKKRNLVAGRFGNLSLLADKDTKIKQGNDSWCPSHIFDIRSRPGFSGSPVFVYRTPSGDLRDTVEYRPPPRVRHFVEGTIKSNPEADARWSVFITEAAKNQFIRLLGIHTAQYKDTVTAYKVEKVQAESDAIIRDGDKLHIPNSMAVVAPAWEILKLLDHPTFQEQRHEREKIMKKKKNKTNEAEPESTDGALESSLPSSDANPKHREDFTSLVNAAARKRERED